MEESCENILINIISNIQNFQQLHILAVILFGQVQLQNFPKVEV